MGQLSQSWSNFELEFQSEGIQPPAGRSFLIQGFFSLGLPQKCWSKEKLIYAKLGVSRTIYVNVDSPNLGFPYSNFLREAQCKKHPVRWHTKSRKHEIYFESFVYENNQVRDGLDGGGSSLACHWQGCQLSHQRLILFWQLTFYNFKIVLCCSDNLNNYILTMFPPQVYRPPTSSEPPLLPGSCSIISSKRQLKTVPKKAKLTCHGAALLSRNPSLTPCRLQPLPLPTHKLMTCGWKGGNRLFWMTGYGK